MSGLPIVDPRRNAHVVIVHVGDHWSMKINGEELEGVTNVCYTAGVHRAARITVEFYPASVEIETDKAAV